MQDEKEFIMSLYDCFRDVSKTYIVTVLLGLKTDNFMLGTDGKLRLFNEYPVYHGNECVVFNSVFNKYEKKVIDETARKIYMIRNRATVEWDEKSQELVDEISKILKK
jgi:hypothetical protein